VLDTRARKYVQPIIQKTASRCLRLGLSATQVTWSALFLGLAAGILIVCGHPVPATVLLWASGYLDAVDGSMARESNRTSPWGTLLDVTFDRLVELGIVVALAIRYPHAQFVLLLLTASIVFSMTVFLTVGALANHAGMKSFYYQAGIAERTEGLILLTFMMLFAHELFWITIGFVVVESMTGIQRMGEARRIFTAMDIPNRTSSDGSD